MLFKNNNNNTPITIKHKAFLLYHNSICKASFLPFHDSQWLMYIMLHFTKDESKAPDARTRTQRNQNWKRRPLALRPVSAPPGIFHQYTTLLQMQTCHSVAPSRSNLLSKCKGCDLLTASLLASSGSPSAFELSSSYSRCKRLYKGVVQGHPHFCWA